MGSMEKGEAKKAKNNSSSSSSSVNLEKYDERGFEPPPSQSGKTKKLLANGP